MGPARHGSRFRDDALAGVVVVCALVAFDRFGWTRAFEPLVLVLPAVLWITVLTLAGWGAGVPLWRLIHREPPARFSQAVPTLALGAGALTVAAGALGLSGLLSPVPLLLVSTVAACGGGLALYRSRDRLRWAVTPGWPWALILVAAALSAVAATSPSPFYDQWHYHLGVPFQSLRAGHLWASPQHGYSMMPANMGLLYTYALAGPGVWAAQMTHWWMGALAVAAVGALAHRLRPGAGPLAAAVFACTPAVWGMATVAGADLGVAAYGACAWLALLLRREQPERSRRWAVLIGVLVGLAVGCKYLAIVTVAVPLGVFALVAAPRSERRTDRLVGAIIVTLAALAVAAPWGLRNLVATGNPVYPFLPSVFGGGAPTEVARGIGGLSTDGPRLFSTLTLGAFERLGFAGRTGVVYLALLPLWLVAALIADARRAHRLLVAAFVLGIALWSVLPPCSRYLLPALALAAAGIGAAWDELAARVPKAGRAVLAVVLGGVLLGGLNPMRLVRIPDRLAVALGIMPSDELLERSVSHWPAVRYINASLPPDAHVLLVAESRPFAIDREITVQDPFARPILSRLAEESGSADEMARRLRDLGITHVLINHAEARRIAAINHRPSYFALDDPGARRRLEELLDRTLTPVWSNPRLRILAVPSPDTSVPR